MKGAVLAALPAPLLSVGSLPRSRSARRLVANGLVVAGYYGAAKLGYALSFAGPVAAIVWLPVGVGISFLYIGGLGLWPGVLVGDLLANNYSALPWGAALGQTCGNLLEVVTATILLRRLVRRGSPLDTVSGVCRMLAAIGVGTAISATVGSLSLFLGHVVSAASLPGFWRTWWLGDTLGALVVVPFALAWSLHPSRRQWTTSRVLEATSLLTAVAVLSMVGFRTGRPYLYLIFAVLLWSALRLGPRGATLAIVVTVASALWNTVHDSGPFYFHPISQSVLAVQLYIAVAAISALCLAALVAEREAYARGLARSRARIVEAADAERRRLERDLHDGAQHRLTALAYFLATSAQHAASDQTAALLERAEAEVTLAIDELRELAHGIHPSVLTDLGLANALRSIAARSSANVHVVELPTVRVEPTAEATAYYVVAEAVTNAQRYADASTIFIRVKTDANSLRVEVDDDGAGGASMKGGSGLQGLSDRVDAVGGSFSLRTEPGRGTHIEAVIPAARMESRTDSTASLSDRPVVADASAHG
jgi:signal transduction histidine kinase